VTEQQDAPAAEDAAGAALAPATEPVAAKPAGRAERAVKPRYVRRAQSRDHG
jgi:hypothetical protein